MKQFLDNLYLVYFSPSEFPYFWAEYYSKFYEVFTILFSAFSLALGICMNSIEFSELGSFLFLFLLHLGFLSAFLNVFLPLINQRVLELGASLNQKIFISYITYSYSIFWFLPLIVTLNKFLEVNSLESLSLSFFILFLIFVFNLVRALSIFGKLEQNLSFQITLRAIFRFVTIPIFLFLYFIIIFLFLVVS